MPDGYNGFNNLVKDNGWVPGSFYTAGSDPGKEFKEGKAVEMPYNKTPEKDKDGDKIPPDIKHGRPSIFNRYYLFHLGHNYSDPQAYFDKNVYSERTDTKDLLWRNPSFTNIIEHSRTGKSEPSAAEYSYEDFLYCSKAGKIPNNHMITLRRFGTPVGDNITDAKNIHKFGPDIGRLVGFVDGETNKWESILNIKVSHRWKNELQAKENTQDESNQNKSFIPGKILRVFDTSGKTQDENRRIGNNTIDINPVESYPNKVFGALNVIDKQTIREKGLDFTHNIVVTFEYDLKAVGGVNPRVAMLDLLSNILAVSYSRGEFWGGSIRFLGISRPTPLGGTEGRKKLEDGDFAGYAEEVSKDLTTRVDKLTGGKGIGSLEGIISAAKTVGKNLLSGVLGNLLSKFAPDKVTPISLLSGADTGEWHLTIGNPLQPVLVMGNMNLTDTEIKLDGPLSNDDFPTKLTVTCTLGHARPRDKDDIESMFNGGNGRMYGSNLDYAHPIFAQAVKFKKAEPGSKISENLKQRAIEEPDSSIKSYDAGRFGNWDDKTRNIKKRWAVH